jgi:hypothetical protein
MDGGMVRRVYGNGWWTQYLARGGIHARPSFVPGRAVPRVAAGGCVSSTRATGWEWPAALSFVVTVSTWFVCPRAARLAAYPASPPRGRLVGRGPGEKMRIACVARLVQADATSCGGLAGANLTRVWGPVAAPKQRGAFGSDGAGVWWCWWVVSVR